MIVFVIGSMGDEYYRFDVEFYFFSIRFSVLEVSLVDYF